MSHIEQHVAHWCRRYPAARPHRDDIRQEAALAAWQAEATYDATQAGFGTYAWGRMLVAVRRYLVGAGVLRPDRTPVLAVVMEREDYGTAPEGPDGPLARKEAWGLLRGHWEGKLFTARQAEALAWVEVGATFAEAGQAVGVSRQAVEQWARRADVASPSAWRVAA